MYKTDARQTDVRRALLLNTPYTRGGDIITMHMELASSCLLCGCTGVLVKVARHKKGVETEEMKRYVAWYLEQHHQQHLGVRIVLIFDFTDAGITNMVQILTDCILTDCLCLSVRYSPTV